MEKVNCDRCTKTFCPYYKTIMCGLLTRSLFAADSVAAMAGTRTELNYVPERW